MYHAAIAKPPAVYDNAKPAVVTTDDRTDGACHGSHPRDKECHQSEGVLWGMVGLKFLR